MVVEDESQQQLDGSALASRTHISEEVFTVRVGDALQDLGGRPMGMQQAMVSPKRSQDRLFLRQAISPVPAQLLLTELAAQVTASGFGDLLGHHICEAARWYRELRQASALGDMAAWEQHSQEALLDFERLYKANTLRPEDDFHPKNPGDWVTLKGRFPPPPPGADVLLFHALVNTMLRIPELTIMGVNPLTARDFAPPPFPGLTLTRNFRGETEDLRFVATTYYPSAKMTVGGVPLPPAPPVRAASRAMQEADSQDGMNLPFAYPSAMCFLLPEPEPPSNINPDVQIEAAVATTIGLLPVLCAIRGRVIARTDPLLLTTPLLKVVDVLKMRLGSSQTRYSSDLDSTGTMQDLVRQIAPSPQPGDTSDLRAIEKAYRNLFPMLELHPGEGGFVRILSEKSVTGMTAAIVVNVVPTRSTFVAEDRAALVAASRASHMSITITVPWTDNCLRARRGRYLGLIGALRIAPRYTTYIPLIRGSIYDWLALSLIHI